MRGFIGAGLIGIATACSASPTVGGTDGGTGLDAGLDATVPDASGHPLDAASASDALATDATDATDATPSRDGDSDAAASAATCSGAGSLVTIAALDPALVPSAVATDGQGNLYVAGSFKGTATLGATTLTATGAVDLFFAKLDPKGQGIWSQCFGYDEGPYAVVAIALVSNSDPVIC